jgi:SAM-dependent methyltransferase
MTLYERDLAYVHATAFGELATGAMPAVLARLHSAPVAVRTVVDVGCGAGVSTRALTDAGFDVVAIEPSPALLAIARTAAPTAKLLLASAYDVELPACEAILALGEPLTYHPPDADADGRLGGFFQRAAMALAPGGQLVLDLIVTGSPSLDARSWRSGDDWAILYETREDPPARRVTRTIETFRLDGDAYRRAREVHDVRLFDEAATASLLRSAGFDVETARAYGASPLGKRRVAFFGTRRAEERAT